MLRAQIIDEESDPENPVDDRRDAGQVVHADPHQADEHAVPGVFAQVDAGQHAQGKAADGHQEDQGHGAEDCRQDAAFGVRLAGRRGEQFPDLAR